MENQTIKTKKVLIITLFCAIFLITIIAGYFILKDSSSISKEPLSGNEEETIEETNNNTEISGDKSVDNIQEEKDNNTDVEQYSVIFLDSDGKTLQSTYFKKGETPYYSGKKLNSSERKFKTWIPSITTVNGNQAYIATYSSETLPNVVSSNSEGHSSSQTTYASVIYDDMTGLQQTLFLPSGTTINFDAGEHGTYDVVPSSITLSNNQQLDITDSSYNPSSVEANYAFKGLSYSGNTMKCEYSLVNNVVNVECKQAENVIKKNDVLYIQLDYLKGTGTQYINTGIKREANSKYDFEFQFDSKSAITYTNVWGCDERERSGSALDKLYLYTTNGSSRLNFGDKNNYSKVYTTFVLGTRYHVEIKDGKYILNGTEYTGIQWTEANNSDCIFWSRIKDPVNQDCLNGKFYYYKTWKGDELKLDLIPAKRISDNVLGMLDLVSGNFLTNAGSGVFEQPDVVYIPRINAGKIIASGSYEDSSSLEITAVANDGYTFVGWSDNATSATRTITVGDNTVYTALFVPNE